MAFLKTDGGRSFPRPNFMDNKKFWLEEKFKVPALDKRIAWLSYGFNGDTAPVDWFLKEGYGGIVSNVNFNQNYLKDPHEFEILKRVYDYAADKGMILWIYDEYQWPSGRAFGLVLDGQPGREWEATGIKHITKVGNGGVAFYRLGDEDGDNIEIKIMCAVLTDEDGTRDLDVDGKIVSASASGDWTLDVYVLRYTFDKVEDRTNFDLLRTVDLLNPDAVKKFIELTHERYKKYLGESFGNVKAFFTDEPNLGNREKARYAVWTKDFDKKFREEFGYEINIPSIFSGDTDYDRAVRLNYYQLVSKLFKQSYIDQISEWCEANGVASSGHLLFEENMNYHVETYGGNFMRVIGGMTIPGVDILWVDPDHLLSQCDIGNYMGLRYVASAAKHACKKEVMIELNPDAVNILSQYDGFGVSIGGLSITRLLGINDFTIINPQRSYTLEEINKLNEYAGRINTVLDEVTECGELAVFYPAATAQALHYADVLHAQIWGQCEGELVDMNADCERICLELLQNQYMYSSIDEESICASEIEQGRMKTGFGCYSTVVVPYAEYISVGALEKLVEFANAGGHIVFIGKTPKHAHSMNGDEKIAELMGQLSSQDYLDVKDTGGLLALLKDYVTVEFDTCVTSGVASRLLVGDFKSDERKVSFFVNASDQPMSVKVSCADGYKGMVSVYHPATAEIEACDLSSELMLDIPAYEGILVVRENLE